MTEKSFADSNILIYLLADDSPKSKTAHELINRCPVISIQVINEMANVLLRKFKWSISEINSAITSFSTSLPVKIPDIETSKNAILLLNNYNFSWWDALIVSSALEAGCTTLWTEDMQHGLLVQDQLTIRNPFLP